MLGEGREEKVRADAAQPEREREEPCGECVLRRGQRAEHDADHDDVGREDDLARDVDEEVARADRSEIPNSLARHVRAAESQVGELPLQPEEGHAEPDERDEERERAEEHEPAAARNEDGHQDGVEDRPDKVAEVLDVEALVSAEQVEDQPKRKARRERERDEERRDPCVPEQLVRRLDQERHEPREHRAGHERDDADDRVEHERNRGHLVRLLRRAATARLRGEADDGRAEPEVEEGEEHRDRADERPDPEAGVLERVQRDRRDDEAGDDRDGVHRIDAQRVAAEEPHDETAATTWKFAVSDPGRGSCSDRMRPSSAAADRFRSQTGPRASAVRRSAIST